MHLLERYALNTGVKIEKPYIYEQYFPINYDKFITFHPIGAAHKNYSHWQEVIDLLTPVLKREDIHIVQIGGNEKHQRTFNNSLNVLGQTSIPQLAYLINRSLLHFGIDSFPVQFAGHYNKKVVALYSHVKPEHRRPYWGEEGNQILIEPDRGEMKPSYSMGDPLKMIDRIDPADIAASVCKLLNLDFNYDYDSIFIGDKYNLDWVDIVPNKLESGYETKFPKLRIRMDWEHNEEVMFNLLNGAQGKVEIVIEKKINLGILKSFAQKIDAVIINYNGQNLEEFEEAYIDALNMLKVNVSFVSYQSKRKNNEFKLKYMDLAGLSCQEWPKKEDAKIEDIKGQIYYKSSRRIIDSGKVYNSYYSYKNNNPIASLEKTAFPVADDELFWRDLPYFNLLKKSD